MKLAKALLIVDIQNDFLPGGALGIAGGDMIIPAANKYIKFFSGRKLPVFISRDWHPAKTKHFKVFGGLWPKHCVQNTKGAAFSRALKFPKQAIILSKGMDPEQDSYSVFQAQDHNNTQFPHLLKMFGIKELYIAGLATDYCVKWSSLDALKAGFKVTVLTDAIQGVDLKPGDSKDALEQIKASGGRFISYEALRGRSTHSIKTST